MKFTLILTEKPSVARDIARVVGAHKKQNGYFENDQYIVTWAIGHLVTLPQPHEINPRWKIWKKEDLPLLPKTWPLKIIESTQSQYKIIKSFLDRCEKVICATDAGREGELIFRYIYEASQCKKPVYRLWISSLTEDAIREGMSKLQVGTNYDSLAQSARARSYADWLIGMNLSRAYALISKEKFFVGRVQTPTLSMIVDRDTEIKKFNSEEYYSLEAEFLIKKDSSNSVKYKGIYSDYNFSQSENLNLSPQERKIIPKKLPNDLKIVQSLIENIKQGNGSILSAETKSIHLPPPLLYDLTELQRHANRLFSFSASETLNIAQSLYETHKLISYPRTDSRHLTQSVSQTLPKIVETIRYKYSDKLSLKTGQTELGKRFVNDQLVTDHHAIIPTFVSSKKLHLQEKELKIYDLICRRLLSCWQEDYITLITDVITQVDQPHSQHSPIHLFKSQGNLIQQLGWKNLDIVPTYEDENHLPSEILKAFLAKDKIEVIDLKPKLKKTKPPLHLTEAVLLTMMEKAHLGTPSTRAAIIETLLSRSYIERKEKMLFATPLGMRLIQVVHPYVKSAELTAKWEKELKKIREKTHTLNEFIIDLQKDLQEKVKAALDLPVLEPFIAPEKTKEIQNILLDIDVLLKERKIKTVGKLFEEILKKDKIERNDFEQALQLLVFLKKIKITEENFIKNNEKIFYRKVEISNYQ